MKTLHRLPWTVAVLAAALAVSLSNPAAADRGDRNGGRSSESRGRGHSDQGYSRGNGHGSSHQRSGDWRSSDSRRSGDAQRSNDARRSGGGDRGSWSSGDRGDQWRSGGRDRNWSDSQSGWSGNRSGSRGDVRYRGDVRGGTQWHRSGGGYAYQPSYRYRSGYRGGYSSYRPRYASYHPRYYYYTSYFPRPRFIYHSGFSLGIVIGSVAPYGYRYYDPYCHRGFNSLDAYYDHCCGFDHPEVIEILDTRGYPVATCAYDDGEWVVDDCY